MIRDVDDSPTVTVLFHLHTGEDAVLSFHRSSLVGEIKERLWAKRGLRDDPYDYLIRLQSGEIYFHDHDSFSAFIEMTYWFQHPVGDAPTSTSIESSFPLVGYIVPKRDVSDQYKRKIKRVQTHGRIWQQGYLCKKPSTVAGKKGSNSRYLVLQDATLFYFQNQSEFEKKQVAKTVVPMGFCKAFQALEDGPPNCVSIDASLLGKRVMVLQAPDQETTTQWVSAINRINLHRSLHIVMECVRHLVAKGLNHENVLPRPSQPAHLLHLDRLFNQLMHGDTPSFRGLEDSLLSGVLRLCLTRMEEPVIPYGLYTQFCAVGTSSAEVGKMVAQLPIPNQLFLHYLCIFFNKILGHTEVNGITLDKLGSEFGPLLLRPSPGSLQSTMNGLEAGRDRAIKAIIGHTKVLWAARPDPWLPSVTITTHLLAPTGIPKFRESTLVSPRSGRARSATTDGGGVRASLSVPGVLSPQQEPRESTHKRGNGSGSQTLVSANNNPTSSISAGGGGGGVGRKGSWSRTASPSRKNTMSHHGHNNNSEDFTNNNNSNHGGGVLAKSPSASPSINSRGLPIFSSASPSRSFTHLRHGSATNSNPHAPPAAGGGGGGGGGGIGSVVRRATHTQTSSRSGSPSPSPHTLSTASSLPFSRFAQNSNNNNNNNPGSFPSSSPGSFPSSSPLTASEHSLSDRRTTLSNPLDRSSQFKLEKTNPADVERKIARYPLQFSLIEDGQENFYEVRVVEELMVYDGREFTPGRFFAVDDINKHPFNLHMESSSPLPIQPPALHSRSQSAYQSADGINGNSSGGGAGGAGGGVGQEQPRPSLSKWASRLNLQFEQAILNAGVGREGSVIGSAPGPFSPSNNAMINPPSPANRIDYSAYTVDFDTSDASPRERGSKDRMLYLPEPIFILGLARKGLVAVPLIMQLSNSLLMRAPPPPDLRMNYRTAREPLTAERTRFKNGWQANQDGPAEGNISLSISSSNAKKSNSFSRRVVSFQALKDVLAHRPSTSEAPFPSSTGMLNRRKHKSIAYLQGGDEWNDIVAAAEELGRNSERWSDNDEGDEDDERREGGGTDGEEFKGEFQVDGDDDYEESMRNGERAPREGEEGEEGGQPLNLINNNNNDLDNNNDNENIVELSITNTAAELNNPSNSNDNDNKEESVLPTSSSSSSSASASASSSPDKRPTKHKTKLSITIQDGAAAGEGGAGGEAGGEAGGAGGGGGERLMSPKGSSGGGGGGGGSGANLTSPRTPKSAGTPKHRKLPTFTDDRSENVADFLQSSKKFDRNVPIDKILRDPEGYDAFHKFLLSEFSAEHLDFWKEVSLFARETVPTKQYTKAMQIARTYVGERSNDAPSINVSAPVIEGLRAAIANPDETEALSALTFLLLDAQEEVRKLLRSDSFRRFKSSAAFKEFLAQQRNREIVRMKVIKVNTYNKNVLRLVEINQITKTISFFRPEQDATSTQPDMAITELTFVSSHVSKKDSKKLNLIFSKSESRLLRHQKEYKLLFRTPVERARFAQLVQTTFMANQKNRSTEPYQPQPLEISDEVQSKVKMLPIDRLAAALHTAWCDGKRAQGWVYGVILSEEKKTHPAMISYSKLTEEEKKYDIGIAYLTLASIMELGYTVSGPYGEPQDKMNGNTQLALLVEFLAENAHEAWAASKVGQGWKFAEVRNETAKEHPLLVPYVDMDDSQQELDRQAATRVLNSLIAWNYRIAPGAAEL